MKSVITTLLCFIYLTSDCQQDRTTRTYDYLLPYASWKLVTKPNGSFIVTTNQIFWPDTATVLKGKVFKVDTAINLHFDTLHYNNKDLGVLEFLRDEFLRQGNHFAAIKNFILFKNSLRDTKRAVTFPSGATATYYRGDGSWANLIELKTDSTYEIRESVHAMVEYRESGKWTTDNGYVILITEKKGQTWLNKYCDRQRLYLSEDFLIGRKTSKKGQSETYYYFNKLNKK